MVSENGEVLKALRAIWHRKMKDIDSVEFNFLDFKLGSLQPVQEHSISYLARSLLLGAQSEGNDYAREVFKANFTSNNFKEELSGSKNYDRDLAHCRRLVK